ncbi:hypothetical protein [Thermomonospora amylolytica]|uniref:hypothetical protein n=1 Tax=Thermomonospora amylolytica TaxID=1411117 RepID=UPI0018E50C3F|nr:hypothetical protein [Thermomonospora amylolytica]
MTGLMDGSAVAMPAGPSPRCWSTDAWERWAADALTRQLLPDAPAPEGRAG